MWILHSVEFVLVYRDLFIFAYILYNLITIKQNHGSCGYCVWEDELLNNASIDPIRQSKHRSLHEFQEGDQNDTAGNDLANDMGEGSDFILTTKRMRITDNSVNPSPVAVSETPEGKCEGSSIEVANSKHVDCPKIKDDLELNNLASWAAIGSISFFLLLIF